MTWSASSGTISPSGLYTAPVAAGTYVIIATSVADTTQSGTATVTVTTGSPTISVSIIPSSAALQTGTTQQFIATVTGTSNTAVSWSASRGTISSSGLYTAPTTAGTYTVKATSSADSTKSATATVTVTTTPPPVGIFDQSNLGLSPDGCHAAIHRDGDRYEQPKCDVVRFERIGFEFRLVHGSSDRRQLHS